MVAYNFQGRFVPSIEAGRKTQTIRANGKRRHAKPGESLQLYTGMRTKACRKIVEVDPLCVAVLPVVIHYELGIKVDGLWITDADAREAIAAADGFESWIEMFRFFKTTHKLTFHGLLIKWEVA
ncbi:hypothetical protein ACQ4M4_12720 [Leptolyngbya sp. AN02str]|uniref:hypothetical protein n=1 Tax=Leptolyngbya sp. AN02str TaxID=3423363 RepID=UPI003D317002